MNPKRQLYTPHNIVPVIVRNAGGQRLGHALKCLVNDHTRQVDYMILLFDSDLDQDEKLYAVESDEVTIEPNGQAVILDADPDQLQQVLAETDHDGESWPVVDMEAVHNAMPEDIPGDLKGYVLALRHYMNQVPATA